MLIPQRQPGAVNLHKEIPLASFVGCADITVSAVASHSAECTPGCLFAALPGIHTHGRDHLSQALQRGAAAILTDFPLADVSLPQCIVSNVPKAYGQICHGMYGHPSRKMGIAGVTGTNGKTTTTWILRSLLQSASRPTGIIGTIEYHDGVYSEPSSLTTPDPMTMARLLAAMRERQTKYAAIELSSHALAQGRPAGLSLDVAIITNVTQDHLDYHHTFEEYIAAKAKILDYLKLGGILVINADDLHWEEFIPPQERRIRVLSFGTGKDADIHYEILNEDASGSRFRLHYGVERFDCKIPLIGRHNVANAVGAACAAIHLGLMTEEIQAGLAECKAVPGRMEPIDCGQDFQVIVDYAHTDDAISNLLKTLRPLTSGKVILVFGAGGDRDQSKRPAMGRAASMADHVIVTTDNPRSEDPRQIIDDILCGIDPAHLGLHVEPDRQSAICMAMQLAEPGDTVIVAGKGHEKIQIDAIGKHPFDDVQVCREEILRRIQEEHGHLVPVKLAG